MKPTDARDLTWAEIQESVAQGLRLTVYHALLAYGPCTTRELAAEMGADLLCVRPRVTELCQLGLAHMTGRFDPVTGKRGHEGLYAAVDLETARSRHEELRRSTQLNLRLPA